MSVTPKLKSTARRAARKTKGALAKVPGPSNNPATNLLIYDVAMRGASMIAGRAVEKTLLRLRYPDRKAEDIVKGGLFAKAVFDRSFSKRESVAKGEEQLAEQAANAPEE